MAKVMEALGMVETKGLVALIEASRCDAEGGQRATGWLGKGRQRAGDGLRRR